MADKKKQMTDDDLLALITDEVNQPVVLWSLLDLQVASSTSHFLSGLGSGNQGLGCVWQSGFGFGSGNQGLGLGLRLATL